MDQAKAKQIALYRAHANMARELREHELREIKPERKRTILRKMTDAVRVSKVQKVKLAAEPANENKSSKRGPSTPRGYQTALGVLAKPYGLKIKLASSVYEVHEARVNGRYLFRSVKPLRVKQWIETIGPSFVLARVSEPKTNGVSLLRRIVHAHKMNQKIKARTVVRAKAA